MELQDRQKWYRLINIGYALYVIYLGTKLCDWLLVASAVILLVADFWIYYYDIYDLSVMQPLRIGAFALLAPLWIYKGIQICNPLLIIFGASFLIFDSMLYFNPDGIF